MKKPKPPFDPEACKLIAREETKSGQGHSQEKKTNLADKKVQPLFAVYFSLLALPNLRQGSGEWGGDHHSQNFKLYIVNICSQLTFCL